MLEDFNLFRGFNAKEGRKIDGELINSSFFKILLSIRLFFSLSNICLLDIKVFFVGDKFDNE